MVKRTVAELKPYEAAGHFNMVAMRIHGKEETGAEKFWMGVSTFLPGGGAEWAYEYVIHKDESISFPPNEGRGLMNESNLPARMLVIINYPNT